MFNYYSQINNSNSSNKLNYLLLDTIHIYLNYNCNLNCNYCYIDHTKKNMTTIEIKNILNKLNNYKNIENTHIEILGGEPTINNHLIYFINNINTKYITLNTNGIKLLKILKSFDKKININLSFHPEFFQKINYKYILDNLINNPEYQNKINNLTLVVNYHEKYKDNIFKFLLSLKKINKNNIYYFINFINIEGPQIFNNNIIQKINYFLLKNNFKSIWSNFNFIYKNKNYSFLEIRKLFEKNNFNLNNSLCDLNIFWILKENDKIIFQQDCIKKTWDFFKINLENILNNRIIKCPKTQCNFDCFIHTKKEINDLF